MDEFMNYNEVFMSVCGWYSRQEGKVFMQYGFVWKYFKHVAVDKTCLTRQDRLKHCLMLKFLTIVKDSIL